MKNLFRIYLYFMLLISSLCLLSFVYLMALGRTEVNAATLFISLYPILGVIISLYLLIIKK